MDIHSCPWCKNEVMGFWDYSTMYALDRTLSVLCPVCGARGPKEDTRAKAVAEWNRIWE